MKKIVLCTLCFSIFLSCQLPQNETNLSPEGISYLQENAIELSLDTEISVPAELFSDKKIILTGEAHYDIDARIMNYQWIVYFHKNLGIRHYISELNWYQANVINTYINGGSISGVDDLFAFWKEHGAAFGSDESYAFIKKLRSYNETLLPENKIQFLGIDVVPLITKIPEMLISYLPGESITPPTSIADVIKTIRNNADADGYSYNYSAIKQSLLENQHDYENYLGSNYQLFRHTIESSIHTVVWQLNIRNNPGRYDDRDPLIYKNLLSLIQAYPADTRFFGQWGNAHIYQARHQLGTESYYSFAAMCQEPDSPLFDSVFTIAYTSSSPAGYYPAHSITKEVEEIADAKGMNQLFFPLDQADSPFKNELILIPTPLDQGATTDYFQALVFLKDTMIMSNY